MNALFNITDTAPPVKGLPRAAAEAETLDARNDVVYKLLPVKSLLNACAGMPFEWTINPYRGCEIGCPYCFARYTHEYMGFEAWLDFERKIFVKESAAEVLARELAKKKGRKGHIAIGTATDPYQPAERRFGITRSLLVVLARHSGLSLSITTKSDLVLRDVDLLQAAGERNRLRVNVTITTPDARLARLLEPRAPTPQKRFAAVAGLTKAGIGVNVFLAPVLPFITDKREDLETIIARAQALGVRRVVVDCLRLRSSARKRYLPFIAEQFPHLLADYRRLYGADEEPLRDYQRHLWAMCGELLDRYGFNADDEESPPHVLEQLELALEG
ncbi:MAG: radical SAM protein [Abditibacteriales bacterium]|nr:radical SAM protein [Abditibacteriales bacterium]MDW8365195.1 radical SAM protein [Abditibacteriales bacterium]